jgi:Ras-related C3 botulinum toxin substrate 1
LSIVNQWYPELNDTCPNVPKIFIGNKIDLRNEARAKNKDPKNAPIEKETAKKIIEEEFKSKYFECSALTQEGLKEIFEEAMRMIIRSKMPNKGVMKPKREA